MICGDVGSSFGERSMKSISSLTLLLVLAGCTLFEPANREYAVFFQERSAQLDSPARDVVNQVAQRANDRPGSMVEVLGFTDSEGSPSADILLSQRRARSIADALIRSGVAANRLVLIGRGQTGEDPGLESRRAEIIIASR
jgi:outer membrane protein OmpA-like peptidoglycan-associated protein